MRRREDPFVVIWQSLDDLHQRFLLEAYYIDKGLPHTDGMDKILPTLSWRTVGALCDLKASQSDAVIEKLERLKLVLIIKGRFALLARYQIEEILARGRQRWCNRATLAAIVLMAFVSFFRAIHKL